MSNEQKDQVSATRPGGAGSPIPVKKVDVFPLEVPGLPGKPGRHSGVTRKAEKVVDAKDDGGKSQLRSLAARRAATGETR